MAGMSFTPSLALLLVLSSISTATSQSGTASRIPGKTEAIKQAYAILEEKGLEGGFSYDNAIYLPVRFRDGGSGVLVAIGFSGAVRGYLMLFGMHGSSLDLLDLQKGDVDWGMWSLIRDKRRVDGDILRLVLTRERGREDLVRLTGAVHQGTLSDEDGHMELLRVSERRLEVLFTGAAVDAFVGCLAPCNLMWSEHQYAFVDTNGDGTVEIVETTSDCEESGEAGASKKECTPDRGQRVYRYDGRLFVEMK